jgi:hypothetical protein
MNTASLIERAMAGESPQSLVRKSITEANVGGPDRSDLTPDQTAAEFKTIADRYAQATPYIAPGYVELVTTQLAGGTSITDLKSMAIKNRDQYIDDGAKVDAQGSFVTWDTILKSLESLETKLGTRLNS